MDVDSKPKGRWFDRIIGKNSDVQEEVMSSLEEAQESGQIKEESKNLINSVFAFDDKLAYEIMTPRTDVLYIDINDDKDEYINDLLTLKHSRIPVCQDDTDNIIGILHIKDFLLTAYENKTDDVDIAPLLRKPYFVPETKNIDALFFDMQKEKQQIAILIDEYGGFSGIVTMEDIIEEIFGDIDDEYDEEEETIVKVDEKEFIVDGDVNLGDLNEELEINLESENSETIGGFILDILGEIPEKDDEGKVIEFENIKFTILQINDRRIERVQIDIIN